MMELRTNELEMKNNTGQKHCDYCPVTPSVLRCLRNQPDYKDADICGACLGRYGWNMKKAGSEHEKRTKLSFKKHGQVGHPEHYGGDVPYEVWKVLYAWGWRDFFKGNIVKYVARAGKKEGISEQEDLEKAKQYLDFLVSEGKK